MWVETRGRQYRVYYRTEQASPKKAFHPFASREKAELFVDLVRRSGNRDDALAFIRNPSPEALRELLGIPAAGASSPGTFELAPSAVPSITPRADHLMGLTFGQLWQRFIDAQRHLEGTTAVDYRSYGEFHLLPFIGDHDLRCIRRDAPLRPRDALPGTVYVDDWVKLMLGKERLNDVGAPMAGTHLSIKFI